MPRRAVAVPQRAAVEVRQRAVVVPRRAAVVAVDVVAAVDVVVAVDVVDAVEQPPLTAVATAMRQPLARTIPCSSTIVP
jgi:hypothetical protein